MQKLQEIKNKMKTVQNIQTVAQTLATVSAAKLSKTRLRAAGLRQYSSVMHEILCEQQLYFENKGIDLTKISPLLREKKEVKNVVMLMVSSDKGMCGNYNLAVLWKVLKFWKNREKKRQKIVFATKGRKGERYLQRQGAEIFHTETWDRHGVKPEDVENTLTFLATLFLSGQADEIHVAYTQFFSPIRREPKVRRFLPVKLETVEKKSALGQNDRWFYEPSFKRVFTELLFIYLRVQLYDMLLESFASEQGARMITMQEAVERAAKKLREYLTDYNRLRREIITMDLLGVLFAPKSPDEETTSPTVIS